MSMVGLTWLEYQKAAELKRADVDFYALVAAAMWRADSHNAATLRAAFPGVWDDLQARYYAPGGLLADDPPDLSERVLSGEPAASGGVTG